MNAHTLSCCSLIFVCQFLEFGEEVCSKIKAQGYWADYIDPCSGLPMLTKSCNKVYSEVDGMECLLNYRAYNAGFCKVLTHPKWGRYVLQTNRELYVANERICQLDFEFCAHIVRTVLCIRQPSFATHPEPLSSKSFSRSTYDCDGGDKQNWSHTEAQDECFTKSILIG